MTHVEHDLSDRRFDLILERLDRIADELAKTNKRLDNDENFLRISKELATLAQKVATDTAEPIKSGVNKAWKKVA